MKKTVVRVVALDMIFLLFIVLSSIFSGALSDLLYFGAYLVPLGAFAWISKGEVREKLSLGIKARDAVMCLPLIAPVIGVTIGLSALVSLLLSFAGVGSAEPLTGGALASAYGFEEGALGRCQLPLREQLRMASMEAGGG